MFKRSFIAMLISLMLINLACTLGDAATTAQPQTQSTLPAQATVRPAGTPLGETIPPVAPAFPTISGQPTLSVTTSADATSAAATQSAAAPTATQKPADTPTPLAFTYEVVKITRNPDNQAVLTLHIIATGGAGGYKYYNDTTLEPGHTFDVPGTCGSKFTHTLKVQSADGQVVTQQYQVAGLCPTPTATPK